MPTAPFPLHPPVNCLHSIENPTDKSAHFLLTKKIKSVKQTRSLTPSKVFPVGAASGARTESLFPSQGEEEKAR
jgi:hypothetical protein